MGNHPFRPRKNVPDRIRPNDNQEAFCTDISPAGIGRKLVLFISASLRYSCIWFKTEVPADNKNTPAKSIMKDTFGELPVSKKPVIAENVTNNDNLTLLSLTNTDKEESILFFSFNYRFKIIDDLVDVFRFNHIIVRLHEPFVEPFDDFNIRIKDRPFDVLIIDFNLLFA